MFKSLGCAARSTQRKLVLFKVDQAIETFVALTKLGHTPTPEWMNAFCAAVKVQPTYRRNLTTLLQLLTGAANMRASGAQGFTLLIVYICLSCLCARCLGPCLRGTTTQRIRNTLSCAQADIRPAGCVCMCRLSVITCTSGC